MKKNASYPWFSFWFSITLVRICFSRIFSKPWKNTFELVVTVLNWGLKGALSRNSAKFSDCELAPYQAPTGRFANDRFANVWSRWHNRNHINNPIQEVNCKLSNCQLFSMKKVFLDVGELTFKRWRTDIRRWRTDFIRWRTDTLAKQPVFHGENVLPL